MAMQFVEREAIVVNNADPLGIGRLQVFIYGVHDITGSKIPFENLPWAHSTQGINFVAIPAIWSPVKVKVSVETTSMSSRSMDFAFADQDGLEWHSPSPFVKLTDDRDPRKFLVYDNEKQKFLNETPINYKEIDNRISSLEEQKKVKEQELEELRKEFNLLTQDENNLLAQTNTESVIETLTEISDRIEQETTFYNVSLNSLNEKIKSGKNFAELTYENRPSEASNFTLEEYINFVNSREISAIEELKQNYKSLIEDLESQKNSFSNDIDKINNDLEIIRKNKVVLQKEINDTSSELKAINEELKTLKSNSASAPRAKTSFESVKLLDARIGSFDEATGKVFDVNGNLIGNWTGQNFYLPGFALQPGTPLTERKQNRLIKTESYLTYLNTIESVSEEPSTIINPPDSSSIQKADEEKTKSCDFSYETRLKILTKRKSVLMSVKWLRDQIAALLGLDSNSAIGQWLKAIVKQLTAMLKATQKFLNFVNDVILEIAKITAELRQLINWIMSLPVRLLVLLQDCFVHFFEAIEGAFSQSIDIGESDAGGIITSDIVELVKQAKNTYQTATETIEATTIVYTEIKTIEQTFEKV